MSRGWVTGEYICPWGKCPGGTCPGGFCPVTMRVMVGPAEI